jgi:hypothetical protein
VAPTILPNSIVRPTVSGHWLGARLHDPIVQQIVADPLIEVLTAGPDRATDRDPPAASTAGAATSPAASVAEAVTSPATSTWEP